MTMTVSITDFRNNIFKYADLVQKGYDLEVEKSGDAVFRVGKPLKEDIKRRGKELYELLKKAKGKFPNWKYDAGRMRRNKVEMEYIKNLDKRVSW